MAERDDEGFLARWSRRKQAARQAEREPQAEPGVPQDPPGPAGANALEPPPEADRAPALPDPATLDASSDFSVFLGRDVPIETHRAALRRLWRLDPLYNRMDGLDDYCEDYTDKAKVVKGLRTAYKVGRGMLEQLGEAAARPDDARPDDTGASGPAELKPADGPAPIAAASADPQPPDKAQPSTKSASESERQSMRPRSSAPRRPRRRVTRKS